MDSDVWRACTHANILSLAFISEDMDVDWKELPVNSVSWYLRIPKLFLKDAGIESDGSFRLENLLKITIAAGRGVSKVQD